MASRILVLLVALWCLNGAESRAALILEPAPGQAGVRPVPGAQEPPIFQRQSNPRHPASGPAEPITPNLVAPLLVQNESGPSVPSQQEEAASPPAEEEPPAGAGESAAPEESSAQASEEEPEEEFDEGLEEDLEEEFGKSREEEISDPFSGYNRAMTSFNDFVFVYVLDPVARAWRWAIPEFIRRGLANFFENLLFPIRFVNNLLQVKFLNAGEELLRFGINTTVGLLGVWDPASDWFGLEAHKEDFGQTLGYWGVGPGPHLVLPILGPSNLRDSIALVPDFELDPKGLIDPLSKEYAVRTLEVVNKTSLRIGEYEDLKKDALDLYPFLRDVYEQNREKAIAE